VSVSNDQKISASAACDSMNSAENREVPSCQVSEAVESTCAERSTCEECVSTSNCVWDSDDKSCGIDHWWSWGKITESTDCPCTKCQQWYETERLDTTWLAELNRDFMCPCTAQRYHSYRLVPTDQPQSDWGIDLACAIYGLPLCKKFHPGADGCLRSVRQTATGAGQQCCYGTDGKLLTPGTPGAGTPDRSTSYSSHQELDVKTYNWCCKECERGTSYCNYYINELRKGNDSHCQLKDADHT